MRAGLWLDQSHSVPPQMRARFGHSASLYGLDTVQMESTFGPMQQGQMFVRSLLQQLGGSVGS